MNTKSSLCHDKLVCHTSVPKDGKHLKGRNIDVAFTICMSYACKGRITTFLGVLNDILI